MESGSFYFLAVKEKERIYLVIFSSGQYLSQIDFVFTKKRKDQIT
jgi:hypothetical protein